MDNVEMAKAGSTERSFLRKSLDKVFLGFSFITLPLYLIY
jgi:membrane-bound acyltransferase YfiQ involved in biofilm formation